MSVVVTLEILCREQGLEQRLVRQWIERDWLRPDARTNGGFAFHDIDVARARLLRELHGLQIGETGVPVVLSLLDQLYDARRGIARLRAAMAAAPETVRRSLLEALHDRDDA